jgi:hypothetical protein
MGTRVTSIAEHLLCGRVYFWPDEITTLEPGFYPDDVILTLRGGLTATMEDGTEEMTELAAVLFADWRHEA